MEFFYYIISLGKGIDVQKSHFQVTKMLKMNITKHSKKGQNRQFFCSNHHGKCDSRDITSQHEYKLPNVEFFYYIISLGKSIDVQKSHFQVTKMLKMNTMKHSKKV